jgi:uncharacterized protein DUF4124
LNLKRRQNRFIMLTMFAFYCGVFTVLVTLSSVIVNHVLADPVYKWVDAEGHTHYSQKPAADGTEVEIIKPPAKVNPERAKKALDQRTKMLNTLREERNESALKKNIAKEEKARLKKNCDTARANLASYIRPGVTITEKDGTRVKIAEEERQKRMAEANERIKEFCI